MSRKSLNAAVLAACVMAAASSMTHAHQTGSIGAEKSDAVAPPVQGSLFEGLFGGPKGPTPPPKFDGSDPVTNPPGPKPPPR